MPDTKPDLLGSWGSYTLGRRIGRGGMGVVHAAVRRGLGDITQLVAVKVMLDGGADRAAFLREARILARLDHPNVVRWLDAGEVGDDVYLAMELLHGAPLSAIIAASPEPLPLPIALAILADLARGLHAAHELCDEEGRPLGLVHQDVSPQNAVVGYDGRTRLVDFGVARLVSVDASRTDTVRGKPAYLAPEQLDGRRLDRRADVFALGVIAFELLTGRRLFARASIAETHTAVLFDPIPDPRDARPDLPAGLAAATTRALARSTNDRHPSAEAFRRAIVDAADAAGVRLADEHEIAALAATRVPPAWSPQDLFTEIEGRSPRVRPPEASAADEASQAVTIAPRREHAAAIRDGAAPLSDRDEPAAQGSIAPPPPRPRRWIGWALVACAAIGAVAGLRALRGRPAIHVANNPPIDAASAPAPPLPAPTSIASVRAPEPAAPPRDAGAASSARPHAPPPRRPIVVASAAPAAAPAPAPPATSAAPAPAPTSSAAPAPAVPANGWISVWSSRWGRVRIDGREVGDSPAVKIVVPAGTHVVAVRTETGEQRRSVVVAGGEDAKVRFVF